MEWISETVELCGTTNCNWPMGDCAGRRGFNRMETRLLQIEVPSAAGMQ
jgi:hypothetical protein